MVVWPPECMTK